MVTNSTDSTLYGSNTLYFGAVTQEFDRWGIKDALRDTDRVHTPGRVERLDGDSRDVRVRL